MTVSAFGLEYNQPILLVNNIEVLFYILSPFTDCCEHGLLPPCIIWKLASEAGVW